MTMITPSYLGETIEYSSLHACRSTLEDPTYRWKDMSIWSLSESSSCWRVLLGMMSMPISRCYWDAS